MLKAAFLFPGQGAQYLGMLTRLQHNPAVQLMIQEANELLGYDIAKLITYGPEEQLRDTRCTQPAIFLVSMAYWNTVALPYRDDISADACYLGHSIGEYGALVACGALSFSEGLRLVRDRGLLMGSVSVPEGCMAVLTPSRSMSELVGGVRGSGVDIAAINSQQQLTLSTTRPELSHLVRELAPLIKSHRVLPNVSHPFHSRWFRTAGDEFKAKLAGVGFRQPSGYFIANATGKAEIVDLVDLLARQISSTVLWEDSINTALNLGAAHFVEMGPGRVLSNLLRREYPEVQVTSLDRGNH